ncbi:probable GPI-anchored adhesin-like protein PGA55 [Nicotiana tomentosiformis]|uniref:probable GPI-anchored adhesin-like protein PGA55 n=1 Tax=Nicotiana tomentosiformis TaxID=4098 RepID=UPI00388C51FD
MGMMVDPERVIFDISSDEEVDGGGDSERSDDYSWIMELLDEGDGCKKDDSSDDVVVVGEVIKNPSRQNLKSVSNATAKPDDDDDDCVVLEEDPDKPVEVENERGGDDSDDLLVVSEKGQIACRDYPHPRHLCAKFPFGSTPHERHCDQCHCYVCDTLAPCVYWCTGVAHCHATDKEKYWKSQRQSTRKIDIPLLLVPPGPNTSVSVHPPVSNQAPGLVWKSPNYPPQNQRIRQAPIRPCSMSSSPGLPNLARQRLTDLRDNFHSRVVSQQLHNASINVSPRDKRHNVSHMGPQFFTIRTAFKRAGSSGQALATGRSGYNSSSASSVPQFGGNHSSVARWQELYGRVPVGSNKYLASSQPNAGILGASSVSCQRQLHKQPGLVRASANYVLTEPEILSQPNAEIRGANAVSSQHRLHGQPALVGVSANYAPMEPVIPSQPSAGIAGANPIFVQAQLPRQPSLVGVSANYALMEPEISSQPSAGMLDANAVLFQPQLPRQSRFVDASANYAPMEPQIPSQPQVSVCANSASSEAPAFSLPYANSSPSQPHLSTLPSVLSEFESFISSENAVSSQSKVGNMYNNPLSSEAQMFSQLYAAGNSTNNLPQQSSVSQLSNQPDDGTSSRSSIPCNGHLPSPARTGSASGSRHENTSACQPKLCRQQISSSDSQSTSQHGYQGENAFLLSFEEFDFGWETHVSQTNNLGKVYNPNLAKSTEISRFSQSIESTPDLDIQFDD